jgi:hypothetical protein
MINERLRTALIDALKNLSPEKRSKLEELKKATEQLKRKDVAWLQWGIPEDTKG